MKGAWRLICVLICMAAPTAASDFQVIANSSVKVSHISAQELTGVFLVTKTSLAGDSHIEPVLLKSGDAHVSFVKQYTGKTTAALVTYYRSLVFTGRGAMPKTFASDAEVVAYVRKTKGAIGYVSAGASTEGVKILEVK
jgi:hypothetical protein